MTRIFQVASLTMGLLLSAAQTGNATSTPMHSNVDESYTGSFFANPYTDPEEGVVAELQVIRVYFPANEDEDLDEGWDRHATLRNLTTGDTYEASRIEGLWTHGKITFSDPVTAPGEYELTVDKGAWVCWSDDSLSPEIVFHYTIEGAGGETSVKSMFSAEDGADVFDVAGRLVVRSASEESIANLAAGIYVIGGKKYIKK